MNFLLGHSIGCIILAFGYFIVTTDPTTSAIYLAAAGLYTIAAISAVKKV